LALGRDIITRILGAKVEIIIYHNICKWAFDRSFIFNELKRE